ncbi:PA2169 family four-helix-bundle protein [Terricaulis sp.]|uniref:PA2169 family four-helix-bundle protein n=1 Tax=Terricaulis sp. TaxID=2768686 RepID=UPI00378456DE
MTATRTDIAKLNHIITILLDARRLYARAADLTHDAGARAPIEATIEERNLLLADTQQMVRELGGQPAHEGSLLGAAHKVFLDVRAVFDRDVKAALAEVERGERYLRDEIRKAMRDTDLSADTRAFLGVALDRLVSGEQRIEGKLEEVKHGGRHAPEREGPRVH